MLSIIRYFKDDISEFSAYVQSLKKNKVFQMFLIKRVLTNSSWNSERSHFYLTAK